jgi:hypothetical protein
MQLVKRFFYLAYYFKQLDWSKFNCFKSFVKKKTGWSSFKIWKDIIYSSLKYNISILEYFQFQFYEISESRKQNYAGTGFMYEYQLLMNPKNVREVLSDKIKFLETYKKFIHHKFGSLNDIITNSQLTSELLNNPSGKIVLKSSHGQCGIGVEVHDTQNFTADGLVQQLKKNGNDLVEEFVVQHDALMELSSSGLNTIRIITQLDKKNQVIILGSRLRITVNSVIDNLAAGNLAASINSMTGIVDGPGVYSDIIKEDQLIHPTTGVSIIGFQVPFWNETVALVKAAALHNVNNRSIGWDVAVTNSGPELIEANHDWCKLLWQLPVKQGLKESLSHYIKV